jgi:putative ABC transport system permease protein
VRTLTSDLRWSLRLIRHRPAFAATVILTLGGAIAVVTTALGVAGSVLWRPLPFHDADRLVFAWEDTGTNGGTDAARVTGYRFVQWQQNARAFSSMALFGAASFLAEHGNEPSTVKGVRVSTNYFSTLGIAPLLGRDFTGADGEPGAAPVVILSHALWSEWFGGSPDAVGGTLRLGGRPYTIVGVMPAALFPAWPVNPAAVTLEAESRRLWVPIARTPALAANTRAHVNGVVARLAEGRSLDDAERELTRMARTSDPDRHGAVLRPFRDQFVRESRLPLVVLVAAALAVLLVACTNLAAVQASAMELRRAELSVRAALGAGRLRLARQFATETAVFAAAGAAVGLLLSRAALSRVPALLPPSVPLLTPPSLDAATIALAAVVTTGAAVILAAWPFARTRTLAAPTPRGVAPLARSRTFRILVVSQVALAVALVAPAALLQQSLDAVRREDPGFAVDRVLVGGVSLPGAAYANDIDHVIAAERTLTSRLSAVPGVRAAAFAYDHPLDANWIDSFQLSGSAAAGDDTAGSAELRIVSPSYFDALDVAVLDGRGFAETDAPGAAGVALVNQAFAAHLLDGPALGRRLRTGAPGGTWADPRIPREFRIVGIVENERFKGLENASAPAVYLSTRQFPQQRLTLLLRTAVEPTSVAPTVRDVVRRFDPGVPLDGITTLSDILAAQLVTRRVTTHVIDGFAAGALALAALGLYGLLALLVAGRRRDTGIRLALGSSPFVEAARVVRDCVSSTAIGAACGLVLALIAARLLRTLLVGVSPRDVATLVGVSAATLGVSLAAAVIPAWRAAHVDPATVLRG